MFRNIRLVAITTLLSSCGCQVLHDKPAGDLLTLEEPDYRGQYVMYKPSGYSADRAWPLLVLCHGDWSNPRSAVQQWTALAEDKGLLLVAPHSKLPKLVAKSEVDEDLAIEQHFQRVLIHVQAAYRVDLTKIFLVASKSGCARALCFGIRNPDLIRAIALLLPNVDTESLAALSSQVDPHQRMLVLIGMADLFKSESIACAEWLQGNGAFLKSMRTAARSLKYPNIVYQFLKQTVRQFPWIRISAYQGQSPMRVSFKTHTSFEDVYQYAWEFGDGGTAAVAHPEHLYQAPGEYEVSLTVTPEKGAEPHRRRIQIVVPAHDLN